MLRHATTSDVPSIRTLMETVPGFWQPWWSDKTIDNAIRSAEGLTFVWEEEFQILGFVCAHDLGFRACLSELVASQIHLSPFSRELAGVAKRWYDWNVGFLLPHLNLEWAIEIIQDNRMSLAVSEGIGGISATKLPVCFLLPPGLAN